MARVSENRLAKKPTTEDLWDPFCRVSDVIELIEDRIAKLKKELENKKAGNGNEL